MVKMLMGRVMSRAIGLKNAFKMPRIAAARNAEKKLFTWIPSKRYAVRMMAPVRVSHLMKIPFMDAGY
jgi:hypothetical protein